MTGDSRSSKAPSLPGIVVVNQHGDNRGDEAAMRAMVSQLAKGLPHHHVTIVHQFSDPRSEVELDVPVDYVNLKMPIHEAVRLALFAALTFLRIPASGLLGRRGRDMVDRYRSARLVISAPGGPYFGDIYADHEIVHWFYVWLAKVLGCPIYLYAPSVGPFQKPLLNPLRRRGFRWFDSISLRDSVSAEYLRALMGDDFEFEVTADSALQEKQDVEVALEKGDSTFLLAVAARDPGAEIKDAHDSAVLQAIETVCQAQPTAVVFLPQLHGPRHRDQTYLEGLAERVTNAVSVRVESGDELDSQGHRRTIAAADLVIAGRYHPAVFAVAAATPALVIPYEHKSWGVARQAGIEDWTVDVTQAHGDRLATVIDDLLRRSQEVQAILVSHREPLHRRALRSTELALEIANRS